MFQILLVDFILELPYFRTFSKHHLLLNLVEKTVSSLPVVCLQVEDQRRVAESTVSPIKKCT